MIGRSCNGMMISGAGGLHPGALWARLVLWWCRHCSDDDLGLLQRIEEVIVQQLIAKTGKET